MRGGKRSTSFTSETAPKGHGGSKHMTTKIKESIGLTGWERLCSFIKNEGADKYVETLSALKGRDFVIAYNSMTEYVKPKLQRHTVGGDPENPIQINSIEGLTFEQLYQLKYGRKPE
jgi:hypothetical protein